MGYIAKLFWVARYTDGTVYPQHIDGIEQSTQNIDKSRLASFCLYDIGGNKLIEQKYKTGQRFMYRCRTALKAGQDVIERVHIIVNETDLSRYVVFVFESDLHIEISDFVKDGELTQDNQLQYAFEFLPYDMIPVGNQ